MTDELIDSESESNELGNERGIGPVRSLIRGLRILDCFSIDHDEWTMSEIARATGLHKATTHRLLRTLEAAGYLAINKATGKYKLGPALLRIAYLANSNSELVKTAYPYMQKLSTETGETVDLAVWIGQGALFIAQVLTPMPFKPVTQVGRVIPGFANAHGKIYLAYMTEEEQRKVLSGPLPAITPYTVTDPAQVAAELERIRNDGVAYSYNEQTVGICAVAVPIRDSSGNIRATLSVVAPTTNFVPEKVSRYTKALKEAAAKISSELGFREA